MRDALHEPLQRRRATAPGVVCGRQVAAPVHRAEGEDVLYQCICLPNTFKTYGENMRSNIHKKIITTSIL